jgi:hypothetical protein
VSWHSGVRKWRGQLRYKQRIYHLEYFTDERRAAMVYDCHALELFDETARLNFPG